MFCARFKPILYRCVNVITDIRKIIELVSVSCLGIFSGFLDLFCRSIHAVCSIQPSCLTHVLSSSLAS